MCGIAGGFWRNEHPELRAQISRSLRALAHRGPDDRGVEYLREARGTTVLAQTRLAVIDLSQAGHQPFVSPDGRYTLVYNGEIYNFKELRAEMQAMGQVFQTQSDTEVLLTAWQLWGEACLDRLVGMFAFAIHDKIRGLITLARDAFGIKPLFYSEKGSKIVFSSELKGIFPLLNGRASADIHSAYRYLVHNEYDNEERTFVCDVRHLLPGHILQYDLDAGCVREIKQWWRPSVSERAETSFGDAADALRELFLSSVKMHLRSDVPLGAALSGGVDSAAIVCAIRHIEPEMPIHTFSYIASGTPQSEEVWVDLVNKHVKAKGRKVSASAIDLERDLDDLIRAQGEPFGSTSIYAQYRVFKLARESGVTVTLEGQGADELLAGYDGYPGRRMLSLLERGGLAEANKFARASAAWPGRGYAHSWMDLGRIVLPDAAYAAARKFMGRNFRPSWLNCDALADAGVLFKEARMPLAGQNRGRRVVEKLSHSLQQHGLPHLLRHGDRNSMAFSIEGRVPFLTPQMADFLLGLPENYLISNEGETKRIFRAAMRGIVPDAILDRRDKIGFATPEKDWMFSLAPKIREWLFDARDIDFIREGELQDAFGAAMSGSAPFTWQVWRWVNYVRWYRHTIIDQ